VSERKEDLESVSAKKILVVTIELVNVLVGVGVNVVRAEAIVITTEDGVGGIIEVTVDIATAVTVVTSTEATTTIVLSTLFELVSDFFWGGFRRKTSRRETISQICFYGNRTQTSFTVTFLQWLPTSLTLCQAGAVGRTVLRAEHTRREKKRHDIASRQRTHK